MTAAATVKRRAPGGLKNLIENRMETPIFLAVGLMMVLRAAQVYSGGALVMSRFLGPLWPAFEVLTGLGLGLGSEMLMTIAGRTWRSWMREADDAATRPGLNKPQRAAAVKVATRNASHSKRFMLLGAGASIYTGTSYLLSNAGASGRFDVAAALGDMVPTALITAVVFYLGVLREKRDDTAADDALSELDAGMSAALLAAVDRFRQGISTDRDNRMIAEHLPPGRAARFRRAVAKQTAGEMWTAAKIRDAAGMGSDQRAIRDLNRQINALAKQPELGLDKAPDGRTWLIPRGVVMETWGEAIAEENLRRRGQLAPASVAPRQEVGQSDTMQPGLPTLAPVIVRREVGATRAPREPMIRLASDTPRTRKPQQV